MRIRLFAAVLALAAATGCSTLYYVRPGSLPPSTAQVPAEKRSAVWQHAITVLLDQGYVPQVLNESAGYIGAKRREDIVDDALAGTTAIVSINPDGGVRVQVSGSGFFHSESEFLSAVGSRQALLAKLITASS